MRMGFLTSFCCTDGECQIILGKIPDALNNLLSIISYRLVNGENEIIDNETVSGVCSCLVNILGRCLQQDIYNAKLFLQCDGLKILNLLLSKLFESITPGHLHDVVNRAMRAFASACFALTLYLSKLDNNNNDDDNYYNISSNEIRQKYYLNNSQVLDIARIVIYLFDNVLLDSSSASALVFVVVNFCELLRIMKNINGIESFLLFRQSLSPSNIGNVYYSIILIVIVPCLLSINFV